MSKQLRDLPIDTIMNMMETHLKKHPGDELYLKWTCPKCGDRVTCDQANTVFTEGVKHEECGHLYNGEQGWGLLLVSYTGNHPAWLETAEA